MKEIALKTDEPYFHYADVRVLDFPNGTDKEPRERCKLKVEFGAYDIKDLKKRGMDEDEMIRYYRDWIYNSVRVLISSDWVLAENVPGVKEEYEALMSLITEKIEAFI